MKGIPKNSSLSSLTTSCCFKTFYYGRKIHSQEDGSTHIIWIIFGKIYAFWQKYLFHINPENWTSFLLLMLKHKCPKKHINK